MSDYSGRLELTWTNKHERLLAHEDGSYTWCPPSDYRVAEVRLLRDAGTSGDTHEDAERAKDNLLIRGDALHALTSLNGLPEYASELQGKVRLIYLDPPFNTQQAFAQYDDALEHSVWLTMMRDRLLQLKKLLAPDGSIWVHLDTYELHYLKVLMDEVFGRDQFRNEIIWKRTTAHSSAKRFGPVHDTLLYYGRSEETLWNPQVAAHSEKYLSTKYRYEDDRGRYRLSDITGAGVRNGESGQVWRGCDVTAKGRHWMHPPSELERLDVDERIYWPPKGGFPATSDTSTRGMVGRCRMSGRISSRSIVRLRSASASTPRSLNP